MNYVIFILTAGMGNVSKSDGELIVYALFNKGNVNHIGEGGELPVMKLVCLSVVVLGYKSTGFTFRLRSYLMGLAKYKMRIAAYVIRWC